MTVEKDVHMCTGYCTHRLYSNRETVLVVPEAYSIRAEKVVNDLGLGLNEKDNLFMDISYLKECIKMSEKDIAKNVEEGSLERNNAISNKRFFEKILERLVK